jgi:phosphatidylglycerophosphate synthase
MVGKWSSMTVIIDSFADNYIVMSPPCVFLRAMEVSPIVWLQMTICIECRDSGRESLRVFRWT